MGMTRRVRRLIGLSLMLALTIPVAASPEPDELGAGRRPAKYHQVEQAIADEISWGTTASSPDALHSRPMVRWAITTSGPT